MKKRVFLFSFLVLILIMPFVMSANESIQDQAKDCLETKIEEMGCSDLGIKDQIHSLLAVKKCKNEVLDKVTSEGCWEDGNSCDLKQTSLAVLGLSNSGTDTSEYENWIKNQSISASPLEWLLQIQTPSETTCDVYDEQDRKYSVTISENKEVSVSAQAGGCLESGTDYWVKIRPVCYGQSFDISCKKDFKTNLLFRKRDSSTFHVMEDVQTASAEGTTSETVDSLCFKERNSCNYEGTLWASITLKQQRENVSSYLPYLIAFADENEGFFPESFLYYLTGNSIYKEELALKQIREKYWDGIGNKYHDTAVALLFLNDESLEAVDNAIDWLSTEQGEDGCWNSGSISDTGFLLYSIWPQTPTDLEGDTALDCEAEGYSCMSDTECMNAGGDDLIGYECPSDWDVCCSKNKLEQTCSELEGEICTLDQECEGTEDYSVSGLGLDEICCIGYCKEAEPTPEPDQEDECAQNGGICRDTCEESEEILYDYSCPDSFQYCCKEKQGGGAWWIWLLIILIILVVLAIVFRDKLKDYYMKLKLKSSKSKGPPKDSRRMPPRRPGMPPRRMPPRRPMPQRKIIPPSQRPSLPRESAPKQEEKSDLDDVLKKLKEMGQ